MNAAPAGAVETGAPSFVVLGPEAMGLTLAPTDLQLLPDGRILVVAQTEIAFGDGVRWDVFRVNADQRPPNSAMAVDRDSQIYTGIQGAFARLTPGEPGERTLTPVANLPDDLRIRDTAMSSVAVVGGQWYWSSGSGAVIAWRPGQTPRVLGEMSSVERIFAMGDDVFLSNGTSGALYQLRTDGNLQQVSGIPEMPSHTITSAVPFAPGEALVGTNLAGLKRFDGESLQPFPASDLLNGGQRIADLCVVGDGLFAAAVDSIGIVFFDRTGRVVQVLGRVLDHRLARVRRLTYSGDGVVWAILNEGVARVRFPAPLSHFEPLLPTGLVFPRPIRHAGQLWIMSGGRAMRGIYDATGRLDRFELDSPPGNYVFEIASVDGTLLATNEAGIFAYEKGGWELVLPDIVNARVGVAEKTAAGSFYLAQRECGFIQRTAGGFTARRFPLPELGDNYNGVRDAQGILWFEMGTSRVARVDLSGTEPKVEILGREEGLTDGWVEAYIIDGVAYFNLPNHIFRFDERLRRFVDDGALIRRFPPFAKLVGRPIMDPLGRVWFTAEGRAHVIDTTQPGAAAQQVLDVGFAPLEYTAETDGVVWMHGASHLARLDLGVPKPSPAPLRALITSVYFAASNRQIIDPGTTLAPIDHSDNSFAVHFAAPANPFVAPVTFEFMLEGASGQWVSTGAVGSAVFNRLKEGRYSLRVRPVAGGSTRGEEARLEFVVRPPWFRTPLAWGLYFSGALGLVAGAAWLSSYLQRRENERLERLVTKRTSELNRQIAETTEKSVALSASEERYRTLNADLERHVQERTAQLSSSNAELAQRESLFRLIFEHAPVGISWKRADLGSGYHFNPTFRRILDLPAASAPDRAALSALVHPDDAARHAQLDALIDSGESDSFNVEERFMLSDGRCVWGSLSGAVVRDERGRVIQEIGILEDISARKKAEVELAHTYKELVDASRMAGMAEVATGVLHNVGNVLNSLNVSSGVIATKTRQSPVAKLAKLSALINEHQHDLGEFVTHDPKGKIIPEFLRLLAERSLEERDGMLAEIASMQKNIDHIKEIVAMQQGYTRATGVVETLAAATLFEEALNIAATGQMALEIPVRREFETLPPITVEKGKVLQILVNLIRNAKLACIEAHEKGDTTEQVVIARLEAATGNRVRFIVRDNGIGIPAENLTRIFAHGFTTRRQGHGFGLHSSANAAREIKGSLVATSEGPGRGATFTLELPLATENSTTVTRAAEVAQKRRPPSVPSDSQNTGDAARSS